MKFNFRCFKIHNYSLKFSGPFLKCLILINRSYKKTIQAKLFLTNIAASYKENNSAEINSHYKSACCVYVYKPSLEMLEFLVLVQTNKQKLHIK